MRCEAKGSRPVETWSERSSDIRTEVCFIAVKVFFAGSKLSGCFVEDTDPPQAPPERKRLEHGDCDDRPKSQKARVESFFRPSLEDACGLPGGNRCGIAEARRSGAGQLDTSYRSCG